MAGEKHAPTCNRETVEVEDDENLYSDDSGSFVDSSGVSETTSLSSSIRNYKYENGRRYHAFREGSYNMPNDEKEQNRLDLVLVSIPRGNSTLTLEAPPHPSVEAGRATLPLSHPTRCLPNSRSGNWHRHLGN
ncbi:hypothetical protein V6Z96_001414 [Aspergillus fumigatus]